MNSTTLSDLYRHMEWADAKVWQATLSCDNAGEDQRVSDLFHHLHLVQHAYVQAFRGEAINDFPRFDQASSLMAWGRSFYSEMFPLLEAKDDADFGKPFDIPWTGIVTAQLGRAPESITLGELMMQVPLHSLYHRGQINARLREIGGEPPTVDYIVWRWMGKPSAEWI